MSERKRDKKGRSALARCVVICIVAAFICSLTIPIPILAVQQTRDTVAVTVNAPEYVGHTFNATIRIDNVTDLNAAQFDLSFNSSVVNVIDVRGGKIDGKEVPIYNWDFKDSDRVRVLVMLPDEGGEMGSASGSGYLAEIEFEVKGKSGEKSTLDISNGKLVNVSAKEIIADWYDTEVTVLRTVVWVEAQGYVNETFNATIKIDTVTDLNTAQFNLSFNSSVVNVTEVRGGVIDSKAVPLYMWNFTDSDTIRVISNLSAAEGANGSGYLAEVEFKVKGKSGDKSKLSISNGKLVNTTAKEINAGWYDTEVTVLWPTVSVDAPESVSGTFNATIRIANVTNLNTAQFNLSFNSSVVNVTDVRGGEIDGKVVPLYTWNFTDSGMITVISNLSAAEGASGAGYLAEIEFEVKGKSGDKSTLNISNGKLVNTKANEINANWYDAEVTVELPNMTVTVTPGTILVSVPTVVTINVTAETTGAPINGATVTLSAGPWSESNTTINGECTFTVTSPFPGMINVAVVASGYNDASAELIAATELPNMTVTVTPGTISVSVPTVVTINVTAETTGAPINGATVTLSAGPWSESNTTSDGECTFTVTSPFPGTINVAVVASGYNDASAELIATTELLNMTVTVTPGTILVSVPTVVTINVTAETTGAPINGATVTLSAGPWSESNTTTNGECTFTVASPFPGTVNVAVTAPGYNDASAELIVATELPSMTVTVTPGTILKLVPTVVTINVTAETTGAPINGATVTLSAGPWSESNTTTNGECTFTVTSPFPGTVNVAVVASGYNDASAELIVATELPSMTVTVTPGTILVSVPTVVTINVTAKTTGAPINGATVTLSAGPWSESNTTTNGECTFTVASPFPGTVNVAVVASGYNDASAELIVATELPNMTVTVTPGTIPVSVTTIVTINVTAETTGAPINGATVTLSAGPWSESNTTTNGECTFTVTSPFPGTINVAVVASGYNDASADLIVATGPSLTWEIEPPTSVEQGDNVTFDVCFSESASYVISIKNSSGVVVKSWSGTEKDPEPMIWTTTTSDAPGDYTIKTGSYPQIIHEHEFSATGGTITCTVFVDANGRESNDRIPAIKLW